jgi:hypothetical protein
VRDALPSILAALEQLQPALIELAMEIADKRERLIREHV